MDILIDPAFGRTTDTTTVYARWDHHSTLSAVGLATTHDGVPRYRLHMRDGAELRCYTREWLYAVVRAYLKTHTSLLVIEAEPVEPRVERTLEEKIALHEALHRAFARYYANRTSAGVAEIVHDFTEGSAS